MQKMVSATKAAVYRGGDTYSIDIHEYAVVNCLI